MGMSFIGMKQKTMSLNNIWLDPRKLVHSGWDDFPIKKGNHHEKNEKDSGVNHPYLA
jgi:hypothetical protein